MNPRVPALLVALLAFAACNQADVVPTAEGEVALLRFTVEAPGVEFPERTAIQLKAYGLYADGKKVDLSTKAQWVNLDSTVARVGPSGVVQLDGAGVARLEVRYQAFMVPVAIQVNAAQLTGLTLTETSEATVAVGETKRFTARAHFDDGSSLDVTDRATWSTDGAAFNLTGVAGQLAGRAEGTGVLRASYYSQEVSAVVRVEAARFIGLSLPGPGVVIKPGDTQQLSLFAVYSDGSRRDVTAEASWSSSDSDVLDLSVDGVVRGVAFARSAGEVLVTARWQDHATERAVLVTARQVVDVRFGTPSVQLALGRSTGVDLVAELDDGTYAVVTNAALFTSSQPDVAVVSNDDGVRGAVTSLSMGATTIEAQFGGKSATYDLLVTAPELVTLLPTLSSGRLAVGQAAELIISGTFTDGATLDLTSAVYLSHGAKLSSEISGGLLRLTAAQLGEALVDVELGAIATQLSFEVTDVALTSVEFIEAIPRNPASPNPMPMSHRLRAIGVYADGVRADVSELCTWSVDDASVVGLSSRPGERGSYVLAHGGEANVTVSIGGRDISTLWTFAANP